MKLINRLLAILLSIPILLLGYIHNELIECVRCLLLGIQIWALVNCIYLYKKGM